jgi:hypothetical protein
VVGSNDSTNALIDDNSGDGGFDDGGCSPVNCPAISSCLEGKPAIGLITLGGTLGTLLPSWISWGATNNPLETIFLSASFSTTVSTLESAKLGYDKSVMFILA